MIHHFSKKGVLILIISALVLVNIGLLVSFVWKKDANKNSEDTRRTPGVIMNDFLLNGIGFSAEQKKQADAFWEDHRKIMGQLFDDIEQSKVQFFILLIDSTATDSTLNSAVERVADKQKEIELRSYARFKNLRALCTQEQQARFDSLYPGVIKELMAFFHHRGPKKPKS